MSSKTLIDNSFKSFKPGNIGYYQFERNLGEGNFAKVKLAVHTITKEKVAVKIIDKTKLDEPSCKKLFREVRIMKLLNHPHIVKLYEVIDTPDELFLIMEYVNGGEIFDYLVAHGKMKEDVAKKHFRQIVEAVHYCHNLKIVHRDLKAENILLDDKLNVKVADFGFSTQFRDDAKLNTWCGSPPYACPELYLGQEYYGPQVDIWSLGVILFVLVCGALPFDGSSLPKLRAKILSGKFKVPYHMSKECENLIRKMIVVDPSQRISLTALKADKWLYDTAEVSEQTNLDFQITPEMHEKIMKELDKIGLDREEIENAMRQNIYNHLQACYYLIADRERKRVPEAASNLSLRDLPKSLETVAVDSKMSSPPELPGIIEEEQQSTLPPKILDSSVHTNGKVRAVSATGRRGRRMSEDGNAAAMAATNAAAAAAAAAHTSRSYKSPEQEMKPSTPQRTRQPSNSPPTRGGRGRSSTVSEKTAPTNVIQQEPYIIQNTESSKVFSNGEKEILPPIVTKRRDRSKTVGVSTGAALDGSDSPVSSKSLDKNSDEPRSLRFTFSLATTSTKDAKHILNELQRVLGEASVEYRTERFVTTCIIDDIEFEIEICKIPLLSLCGLRIKRLIGNSWDYKNVVSELVKKMDL